MLLGYFYLNLNIEGKGKRDVHIISQIIFTRCLRLTLRTSKMPKNFGWLTAPPPPKPPAHNFASLGREPKQFSHFFPLSC